MDIPVQIEQIKNPREWTKEDSLRQALSTGLLALDWGQTHDIRNPNRNFRESNPILGHNPSREKINQYFAIATLANLLIPRMLPPKKRRFMQNLVIGTELGATGNNINLGVKATF